MKTQLLGFVLMFSLLFNVGFAQESLLDDGGDTGTDSGTGDLFGDDFFSDLDSFLEEAPAGDGGGELEAPIPPAPSSDGGEDLLGGLEDLLSEAPIGGLDEVSAPVAGGGSEDLQSSAFGQPGVLPNSAQVNLTVTNISQDDQNAQVVGARPGDVLAYTISLNSPTEDVIDFIPTVNIANISSMVEFTDTGFGVRENGNIIYPAYSHQAPCEQEFTFFVRVLDQCVEGASLQVSSPETGGTAVNLNCGLAQTGPTQQLFLLLGLVMLIVTLFFTFSARSKHS